MKNLFFVLFLIPCYLFSQQIQVKDFNIRSNDMDARINFPIVDQNGEKCAIIKVVTTEKGFVWDPDALGLIDAPYKTGEYWLYIPHGARRITIKHAQLGVLRDYVYPLPIKEATVYEMILVTGKVTTIVEAIETPMQWLTIASKPEGADVYINEEYMGVTPYQKKMEVGKYNYRISKAMYHGNAGVIDLALDKTVAIDETLKPKFGYLNISTSPENGASIEIDGRPLDAVTPFTTTELMSGKHRVTVKKVMFKPQTSDFEINDGETKKLNLALEPNFATINISSVVGSQIYIDDEKKGDGNYTGRLMPGLHTFEARKENHTSDKKQQELVAGENQSISLHPIAKTGSVDIMTNPFGAAIILDGKDMGITPTTLKDLLIGKHNLILKKTGHTEIATIVNVEENQTVTINESLKKGTESISKNEQMQSSSNAVNNLTITGNDIEDTKAVGFYSGSEKYGADEKKCMMSISLFSEYYKQKNYNDAVTPWRYVFFNCPQATKNTYLRGVRIYKNLIIKETDKYKKEALIDTLMLIYDQRIKHFGQEGMVLAYKGIDLFTYKKYEGAYEVYTILRKSIELEQEKSKAGVFSVFMNAATKLFIQGNLSASEYNQAYNTSNRVLSSMTEYNNSLLLKGGKYKSKGEKELENIKIAAEVIKSLYKESNSN